MKVIIPVAGRGVRLRPLTDSLPKALLPVGSKLVIDHYLGDLKAIKPDEVIFIVNYFSDKIEKHVRGNYDFKVRFLKQDSCLGLGHAISLTKDYIEPEEPVLIILGDTVFRLDLELIVKKDENRICVKKVSNPSSFGIIELNKKKEITKFVEKPDNPTTDLAIVGVYFIKDSAKMFAALDSSISSDEKGKDGEIQLTDAFQTMLESGSLFKSFNVESWLDCGSFENILQSNTFLLKDLTKKGVPFKHEGVVVIPPIFIGKNNKFKNCKIGPYVSIGDNNDIRDSIIKETVIGNENVIESLNSYESIITNKTEICLDKRNMLKLILGEKSSIL